MPHLAPPLCVHRFLAVALLSTPAGGTRRQFRRDLLHCLEGERHRYSVDKCVTQLSFFWPQALLPFANAPVLFTTEMFRLGMIAEIICIAVLFW